MARELVLRLTRDDFRLETFRSGGKGGQNQNKRESGVRIVHPASGAVGESREERSQYQNRCTAFRRLAETPTFRTWLLLETQRRLLGRDMEAEVDALLASEHLLVEVGDGTHWQQAGA